MPNKNLRCAALLGFALLLPTQTWSQAASQANPVPPTWLAEARYADARELERAGKWSAAMQAYQEAAAGGHGPAQKRLGEIYNNGHGDVQRDYETSLRWYQRAREQGEDIPLPFIYPGVRR
jgi:TPR repeat protein